MRESDEYQISALNRPRVRGRLGDLTESKKAERGELVQGSSSAPDELPTQALPPTPKIQSGVMATYDTLPANGGRFSFGQLAQVGLSNDVAALVFQTQVPAGRVLIARQFRVNIEDTFSIGSSVTDSLGIPTVPFTVSLFLNGNAEIFNQNIFVQAFDDYYPCALIAGPMDIVTITVNYDFSGLPTPPGNVIFITHLNGDILLPNELPVQYTALALGAVPNR